MFENLIVNDKVGYAQNLVSQVMKILVEKKFNTTVISSNQAIIWDCLKLININTNISGYGKLFQN